MPKGIKFFGRKQEKWGIDSKHPTKQSLIAVIMGLRLIKKSKQSTNYSS